MRTTDRPNRPKNRSDSQQNNVPHTWTRKNECKSGNTSTWCGKERGFSVQMCSRSRVRETPLASLFEARSTHLARLNELHRPSKTGLNLLCESIPTLRLRLEPARCAPPSPTYLALVARLGAGEVGNLLKNIRPVHNLRVVGDEETSGHQQGKGRVSAVTCVLRVFPSPAIFCCGRSTR